MQDLTAQCSLAQYVQQEPVMKDDTEMKAVMLYDSDAFVVVHIPFSNADGFEIVDKVLNRGVFLTGKWADVFQKQINKWHAKTPHQEAVDKALERYAVLAQNPLIYH